MEQTDVGIVTPCEFGSDQTWSERTRRRKRTALTQKSPNSVASLLRQRLCAHLSSEIPFSATSNSSVGIRQVNRVDNRQRSSLYSRSSSLPGLPFLDLSSPLRESTLK